MAMSAIGPAPDLQQQCPKQPLLTQAVQKRLLLFLCGASLGLDGLSRWFSGFVDLIGSRGLVGRDLRF